MAAIIINSFNQDIPVLISYGLDLELQYTGTLDFRNKLGVDIEVEGKFIGSAEVDFSQTSTSYFISIGGVIKQYIEKRSPETLETGLVTDLSKFIKVTPYNKTRGSNDSWNDKIYGNYKSFNAYRGINSSYYLVGNTTPEYPGGSQLFNRNGGTYSFNYPDTHWGYLYYGIPNTTDPSSRSISGTIQYWGTFNPIPDDPDSLITTIPFDISSTNAAQTAFLRTTKPFYPSYEITKIVYIFDEIDHSQSGDTVMKSWNISINYKCTNDWDFKLSLVFLDSTFNWSSIPFYVKNENTLNRTVNTSEDYYYAKKDYNLKVRRVFNLKSDYMSKEEVDSILLLGITPEIKVKTAAVDAMQDARLLTSAIPVVSGRNNNMYQLEIQIELSSLILTP